MSRDAIHVHGVSFGDNAIEIIYLDDYYQFQDVGDLHTVYVSTRHPDLEGDYELLQNMLKDLLEWHEEETRRLIRERDGARKPEDELERDTREFQEELRALRERQVKDDSD